MPRKAANSKVPKKPAKYYAISSEDDEIEPFDSSDDGSQSGGDIAADDDIETSSGDDSILDIDPDEVNPEDSEEIEADDVSVGSDGSEQSGGSGAEDDEGSDEIVADMEDEDDFENNPKVCHKKGLKDIKVNILDEDDCKTYAKLEYTKIDDDDRITDPYLSYYEIVGVIGIRAQQFNYGAPPLVKGLEGLHPAKMAYVELLAKMTPLIVRRNMPNKKYEDWHIRELEMIHTIEDPFFVPEDWDWDKLMEQSNKFRKEYEKYTTAV